MHEVGLALLRSIQALAHGRVWLLILGPVLVALIICLGLSLFLLESLVAQLGALPPLSWLTAWGAIWLAKVLAMLGGWLAVLTVTYLVTLLLAAVWIMPLLVDFLASHEYPGLERKGQDNVLSATWNSLSAIVLFLAGWLLTLPLWLIPGLALILPIFWMAWLTRRTFAYDALAQHATPAEWRLLRQQHAFPLLLLGLLMALLAHVPVLGMLVPTLAALAYTTYCLEALHHLRQPADSRALGVATEYGRPP